MDKIAEVLKQLAAQLGTTVQYLWGVMIMQARVAVIQYVWQIIMGVMMSVFGAWMWKKSRTWWKDKDGDEDLFFTWRLVSFFIIVAGVVLVGSNANDLLTAWLNPEYWALQEILKKVR